MGYFDFNQPVSGVKYLKAKWCKPKLAPITLTCVKPGPVKFKNLWEGTIYVNDIELEPYSVTPEFQAEEGDVFIFTEKEPGTMQRWADYYYVWEEWGTGELHVSKQLDSLYQEAGMGDRYDMYGWIESWEAQFTARVPDLSVFLQDNGKVADKNFFSMFAGGWRIVGFDPGTKFDTSTIERVGKDFFLGFMGALGRKDTGYGHLKPGWFDTSNIEEAGEGLFAGFFPDGADALPEGSFRFNKLKEIKTGAFNSFADGNGKWDGERSHFSIPEGAFFFENATRIEGDRCFANCFCYLNPGIKIPDNFMYFPNVESISGMVCFTSAFSGSGLRDINAEGYGEIIFPENFMSFPKLKSVGPITFGWLFSSCFDWNTHIAFPAKFHENSLRFPNLTIAENNEAFYSAFPYQWEGGDKKIQIKMPDTPQGDFKPVFYHVASSADQPVPSGSVVYINSNNEREV